MTPDPSVDPGVDPRLAALDALPPQVEYALSAIEANIDQLLTSGLLICGFGMDQTGEELLDFVASLELSGTAFHSALFGEVELLRLGDGTHSEALREWITGFEEEVPDIWIEAAQAMRLEDATAERVYLSLLVLAYWVFEETWPDPVFVIDALNRTFGWLGGLAAAHSGVFDGLLGAPSPVAEETAA